MPHASQTLHSMRRTVGSSHALVRQRFCGWSPGPWLAAVRVPAASVPGLAHTAVAGPLFLSRFLAGVIHRPEVTHSGKFRFSLDS
jgi:hypothetical protein